MRFALSFALLAAALWAQADVVTITPDVQVANVQRIGINLGALEKWGPGQYLKNLVHNPGFESGEYNQLVPVIASTTSAFQEAFWNAGWNKGSDGKPAGFWEGGTYEVLTGVNKGATGTIAKFTLEPDYGSDNDDLRNTYYVYPPFPKPCGDYDIIRVHVATPAAKYYDDHFTDDRRYTYAADPRPGSPGKQSIEIHGRPASKSWWPVWNYYMDSYGRDSDREAGKMIVFKGKYRIAFWAKADKPRAKFRIRLQRSSGEEFIVKTFDLTTDWAKYEYEAEIPDGADPYPGNLPNQPAVLTFNIDTGDAVVWLDDLYFGKATYTNPTAFCDELVAKLKEYNPGVIRDWSTQLGAGLLAQIEEPYAHGTWGASPKGQYGGNWGYSLSEFLALCEEVGADPWYVVPPTFSPDELRGLVEYLAAPADAGPYAAIRAKEGHPAPWTSVFKHIHLEYGNEMWGTGSGGDPFYGSSALGGPRLGQICNDRFTIVRNSPHFTDTIKLIVGGQAGWPPTNQDIMKGAQAADTLAIAPYFGTLKTWDTPATIFDPLLASPEYWTHGGMVTQCYDYAQKGKPGVEVAVYENNFHTTKTAAPEAVTNGFVAGFGGALSLSRHSLEMLQTYSIRTQCPFSFVGFSFPNQWPDNKYGVRVWGMLRDLLATGRERPTWLGCELANQAIAGDLVKADVQTDQHTTVEANDVPATTYALVQAYPFKDGDRLGVVLYNLDMNGARKVTLNLPSDGEVTQANLLSAPSLDTTNEEAQNIRIKPVNVQAESETAYTIDMPATSMAAIVFKLTSGT